jgi:hypothetical protein
MIRKPAFSQYFSGCGAVAARVVAQDCGWAADCI